MPGFADIPGNTQPWGTQVFSGVRQAPTAEALSPENGILGTQILPGPPPQTYPQTITTSRTTTWNVLSLGITSPMDIPNSEVWYDASVLADFTFTTGTTVQKWADKSGNAGPRFISQGTSGNLPERTGTLNGLATVVWGQAGADTAACMTTVNQGYNPPAQPLTFWCVAQVQSTSVYRGVIGGGGGVQGIRRQGDNSLGFDWGTAVGYAMDNTNYHIIVAVAAGASSRQRIDGVQVGAANTGAGDPSVFGLGVDNDNQHLTGAIAEAGMYSRALTTTELTQLETYLNNKWFSAPGTTSISENFNTGTVAADANFTNVLGTVVISGGKLVSGSPSSDVSARHNTHLSSVDHYAEATLTFGDPFGTYSGPCVRYSPSATARTTPSASPSTAALSTSPGTKAGLESNLGSQGLHLRQRPNLRSPRPRYRARRCVDTSAERWYAAPPTPVCRPAIRSASTSTCTATRPAVLWICSQPVCLLLGRHL